MSHSRVPQGERLSPIVVGLGEVLWDVFQDQKRLGGAPANFVYHAKSMGCDAKLISAVGDDLLGQETLMELSQTGVGDCFIQKTKKAGTGRVLVNLDLAGQPTYSIESNSAWDYLEWTDELESLAGLCAAVCFGTLGQRNESSRNSIRRFLQSTRGNALRVLDVNIRPPFCDQTLILDSLNLANVLKLNESELPDVGAMTDIKVRNVEAALSELAEKFQLKLVAYTRGADGALLLQDGAISHFRLDQPVKIQDTVGAGDAFTAAVVFGMLHGWPLDKMNELANRLASFVCTQLGATPPISDSIRELFVDS